MKYVIVLGFIAVLVGVYAYNSLFGVSELASTGTQPEVAEPTDETAVVSAEPEIGTDTLEALRLRLSDLECTIAYQAEEGEVEGTLFTSDGELRGDFLTPSPDLSGQMLSSMIVTDSELMMWTEWEGEAQGMKVNLAELNGRSANEPISRDEDVRYECESWSPVDRSVFEAPSDVLFYDFGDLMNAGMENATLYEEVEMQ